MVKSKSEGPDTPKTPKTPGEEEKSKFDIKKWILPALGITAGAIGFWYWRKKKEEEKGKPVKTPA